MNRKDWFRPKWNLLNGFILVAIVGAIAAMVSRIYLGSDSLVTTAIIFLALAPLIFGLAFIPIIHWRERYSGKHPNIWGFFLVFETSGLTKILYWFMHVIPDWKKKSRYSEMP